MFFFITFSCINEKKAKVEILQPNLMGTDIVLDESLNYFNIVASEKYLVWFEAFTKRIFFKNLESNVIKSIELKKGRGPFEYINFGGLVIINNEFVLLDRGNKKIFTYDFEEEEFQTEFMIEDTQLSNITSFEEVIYGKGMNFNSNSIFHVIDSYKKNLTSISKATNELVQTDYMQNMFRFDGRFISNDNYLINFRFYEPSFYLYNLNESVMEEYEFATTEIEPIYPVDNLGFVTSPPRELSFRLRDAVFKPKSNNVFIIASGVTDNLGNFSRSNIYEFDFINNKIAKIYETDLESIREIAVNEEYLFLLSDKKFVIRTIEYE